MPLIYIEVTDGSEKTPNNLLANMVRQRHAFNPDFASQYTSVVKWHLEVEDGRLLREIGFAADGRPVVIGPFGRNDGIWGRLPCSFGSPREPRIDPSTFQRSWDSLAVSLENRIPPKVVEPVKPMDTSADLEGRWITGSQGSMSHDVMEFFPDGRGYHETNNAGAMWYDSFRWQLIAPGYISIEGDEFFQEDDERNVVSVPSDLDLRNVAAETEIKHFGDGSALRFLYLRPAATEYWRPPEKLYFPDSYYRCPLQPEKPAFPKFRD